MNGPPGDSDIVETAAVASAQVPGRRLVLWLIAAIPALVGLPLLWLIPHVGEDSFVVSGSTTGLLILAVTTHLLVPRWRSNQRGLQTKRLIGGWRTIPWSNIVGIEGASLTSKGLRVVYRRSRKHPCRDRSAAVAIAGMDYRQMALTIQERTGVTANPSCLIPPWRPLPGHMLLRAVAIGCTLPVVALFVQVAVSPVLAGPDLPGVSSRLVVFATYCLFVRLFVESGLPRLNPGPNWAGFAFFLSFASILILPQVFPRFVLTPRELRMATAWCVFLATAELIHALALVRIRRPRVPLALGLLLIPLVFVARGIGAPTRVYHTDSVPVGSSRLKTDHGSQSALACIGIADGGAAVGLASAGSGKPAQLVLCDPDLRIVSRYDLPVLPNILKSRGKSIFAFNGTPAGFSGAVVRADLDSRARRLPADFRLFACSRDIETFPRVFGWVGTGGKWPRAIVAIDLTTMAATRCFMSDDIIAGYQVGSDRFRWLSVDGRKVIVREWQMDGHTYRVGECEIPEATEVRPAADLLRFMTVGGQVRPRVIELNSGRTWLMPLSRAADFTPVFAADVVAVKPHRHAGWQVYRLPADEDQGLPIDGLPDRLCAPSFSLDGSRFLAATENPELTRTRLFLCQTRKPVATPIFPHYGIDVMTLAFSHGRNWSDVATAFYVTRPSGSCPTTRLVRITCK